MVAKTIKGEGEIVTKTLNVEQFNSIELSGTEDVIVQQGTEQLVSVTGNDNIIQRLKTDVANGTWSIKLKKGSYKAYKLTVYITIPTIKEITLSGTGSIYLKDFENQKNIAFKLSGTGNINVNSLVGNEKMKIDLSGTGNFVANSIFSTVQNLDISMSGTGSYLGFPINTKEANIFLMGSGNCNVSSSKKLEANISGSGNIMYKGKPEISKKITGVGNLIAVD